jgi:D-glycero-alpha-D-manno-heptose-7-phosphate kinase
LTAIDSCSVPLITPQQRLKFAAVSAVDATAQPTGTQSERGFAAGNRMVISRTPVRVSFFGGGTDYREYFERKGGAVLGGTIDKHIYVSVNRLSNFFDYKIRVGYSKAELVNNALYALEGKIISKQMLAEQAVHIEQQMIKERVGCQDQFHAAFGGLNIIEFTKEKIAVRPVIISKEKLTLLEESMMSFYTGLTRYASDILKEQVENTRNGCKDDYLERMYQMVFEAEKIISDQPAGQMIENLGKLLHEGWELKKRLSSKISNGYVDRLYRAALKAGAYGGKLSGAGGGGFLSLIVSKDKQDAVRKALDGLLEVNFKLENEGSKIIYLQN